MEMQNWLLFVSIITLVSFSPGPNVLAVTINACEAGIRGAFFTCYRFVWKDIYEKHEALIVIGIYRKSDTWYANEPSV